MRGAPGRVRRAASIAAGVARHHGARLTSGHLGRSRGQAAPARDERDHRERDARASDVGPADPAVPWNRLHASHSRARTRVRPPRPCYRGAPPMAQPPPLYDLVLLLDSEAPEEQHTKVLDDSVRVITAHGEIVSDEDWGLRALAFEIRHKGEAQYHLLQFHASREALEELNHMLHIADGVVRYRIIKLKPGTAPSTAAATGEAPAEAEPAEATA